MRLCVGFGSRTEARAIIHVGSWLVRDSCSLKGSCLCSLPSSSSNFSLARPRTPCSDRSPQGGQVPLRQVFLKRQQLLSGPLHEPRQPLGPRWPHLLSTPTRSACRYSGLRLVTVPPTRAFLNSLSFSGCANSSPSVKHCISITAEVPFT